MTSEPEDFETVEFIHDELDHYRRRCDQLETAVTGAHAILHVTDEAPLDPPDAGHRVRRAAVELQRLLDTEPPSVLVPQLREIQAILRGGDR